MANKIAPATLILASGLLVATGAFGDWASYRNDTLRTGNQPQSSPLSDPKVVVNLTVTHSFPAGNQGEGGSFEASPIVSGVATPLPAGVPGRVFVGSTSGVFYALDAITLTKLWQYPVNAQPNGNGALLGNCNPDPGGNGTFGRYGIHASAALAQIGGQDAVIFGAPDPTAEAGHGSARLFALNANNGQAIWKADGVHDGSDVVAHVDGCHKCDDIAHITDPTKCDPRSLTERHERIANSSPLVFANKVYVGVHDSGDDPIQKGKVVVVDLATGKWVPSFNYVSTGTPQDDQRGGGVWSALSVDVASIYFTTGNTRIPPCFYPYDMMSCPLPTFREPSPNNGLSMVSVDRDTGTLNWAFQPVPFARDGDPDWAAGAAVVHASCGTVITSVMKDGWAYGINPDRICRWQFPQTTPAPPAAQACMFPTNDNHVHGDDGYRQPAAVSGNTIIVRAGGESLINDGVRAGYGRLVALDVCAADDAHRVKWITDPLVPTSNSGGDLSPPCTANPSENEFALGAPTVTGGIVYVTANEAVGCDSKGNQFAGTGHVLAIADPSVSSSLGPTCSNPDFSAVSTFGGPPSDCVANGYSVVPDAAVLVDVALPDQGDAVHLRKEPVISGGKLYVATSQDSLHPQGGHVYLIEPASLPPPQTFRISASMTETQVGPDICINGQGFTPPTAKITYSNIPGRTTPFVVGTANVNPDGKFIKVDTSQEGALLGVCSNTQIQQNVTIEAVDPSKGTATTAVPGAYWCATGPGGPVPVATNYNGSCH